MSTNDGRRIQSIDSIETYVCRKNKEVVHKKEEIECVNILKHYKKWLTVAMLRNKT